MALFERENCLLRFICLLFRGDWSIFFRHFEVNFHNYLNIICSLFYCLDSYCLVSGRSLFLGFRKFFKIRFNFFTFGHFLRNYLALYLKKLHLVIYLLFN
jgi:hypothetical protein